VGQSHVGSNKLLQSARVWLVPARAN
jgi:hypothetical protein